MPNYNLFTSLMSDLSKMGSYSCEYLTILLKYSSTETGKKYQNHLINALNIRYKDKNYLCDNEKILSVVEDQINGDIITNIESDSYLIRKKFNIDGLIPYLKMCHYETSGNVTTFNNNFINKLGNLTRDKFKVAYGDSKIIEMNKYASNLSRNNKYNCKVTFIPLNRVYSPIYIYYCMLRGFTVGKYVMIKSEKVVTKVGDIIYALETKKK